MKNILPILAMSLLATAAVLSEGRPEVSICQPNDCQNVEDPLLTRSQSSRELLARLSHDNGVVLKNFDLLASEIDRAFRKEKMLKADEVRSIYDAIDFAAEKHKLQMRKNKEKTPYISHPLGVAYNVMHYGEIKESAVVIGALLHDTVEDTQTTFEELEKRFGKQVASYVHEMTDNKKLDFSERKRIQVLDAPKRSKGAAEIQLADKLYNIDDLLHNPPQGWSRIRIERYYQWVQSVVERLPEGNEAMKKQIHHVINAYWEQQKSSKS
jgi:guanosine-3',5'-bis(diphosphate) 3'-pyrophosphohydrolase